MMVRIVRSKYPQRICRRGAPVTISVAQACAFVCMECCLFSTYDDPDFPEAGAMQAQDLKRCANHSSYGIIMNAATDHASEGWGFDPREIKEWLSGPNKVLVSYAKDDNDAPLSMENF